MPTHLVRTTYGPSPQSILQGIEKRIPVTNPNRNDFTSSYPSPLQNPPIYQNSFQPFYHIQPPTLYSKQGPFRPAPAQGSVYYTGQGANRGYNNTGQGRPAGQQVIQAPAGQLFPHPLFFLASTGELMGQAKSDMLNFPH